MADIANLTPRATYGDKVKLDTMKRERGSFGATVQKNPTGRPTGKPLVPVTPVVSATETVEQTVIPQEHVELARAYAAKLRVKEYWDQRVALNPDGPFERFYARLSAADAVRSADALKQGTPDY